MDKVNNIHLIKKFVSAEELVILSEVEESRESGIEPRLADDGAITPHKLFKNNNVYYNAVIKH